MKSLVIPIHSFVDLITNSSSEIFVSTYNSTVDAVKELINNVLKGAGSDKTCDDLFEITHDGESLTVTPKNGADENLVQAAKTLSDLTGIFGLEGYYNG